MRILITGPTGNVGSALVRALLADSEVDEVVGVARRLPDTSVAPWSDVTWVQADLSEPSSLPVLTEAARGCDVVVHLAWALTPTRDMALLERVNVAGTARVVEATLAAGVPHLVHTSSVGAYSPGPKDRRVDEQWPTGGISGSWYSVQKAACERLLDDVERAGRSLTITRVRPAPVVQRGAGAELGRYGLGQLVPRWAVGRLTPPLVPLPREMRTQVVHSEDLAEAFRLAVHARPVGGLNVAGEPVLGPDDLARAVGARRSFPVHPGVLRGAMDLSWHLRLQPLDPGWFDLGRWSPLMDTTRLVGLGWTPLHRGDDALAEGVTGIRDAAGDDSTPLLRPGR